MNTSMAETLMYHHNAGVSPYGYWWQCL